MNLLSVGNLIDFSSMDPLITILLIATLVLGAIIFVTYIVALVFKILIIIRYNRLNKKANSAELTGEQAARYFLDKNNLQNIKVQKTGWFRTLFTTAKEGFCFSNSYNIYKKTIFLRKPLMERKSITALAMATQKVGLAVQDKEDDKKFKFVARMKPIVYIAPFAFMPLVIIGLLLDFLLFEFTGVTTIIMSLVGLAIFVISFVILLLTIPVEAKANRKALEMMDNEKILSEEERKDIELLYKSYMQSYIIDFILAILYIIWQILKISLKAAIKNKK